MDSIRLFSKKRLSDYKNENEHKDNFLLMQSLAPKLGIIEIISRNQIARVLNITDDDFISNQTFGYWCKVLNEMRIHNKIVDLSSLDMRKYSKFNKSDKFRDYQKAQVCYSLLLTIRNRAFHFENLYKLNKYGAPRISTKLSGRVVGIEPAFIESFLDDVLKCFDNDLVEYLK